MIIDDIFEIWFLGSIEEEEDQYSLSFFNWIEFYVLTTNMITFSEKQEIINYLIRYKKEYIE
jgi:hypothetical protein